jgi:hypothetical protein
MAEDPSKSFSIFNPGWYAHRCGPDCRSEDHYGLVKLEKL